jgi:hypothetical protein
VELAGFVRTKLTVRFCWSMISNELVLKVGSVLAVRLAQTAQAANRAVIRLAVMIMARRL